MKTFIINVSTNEVRRNHMISMLAAHPCLQNYSFMHQGDLNALDQQTVQLHFKGETLLFGPAMSCALKHILVYKELVSDSLNNYCLILEDDVFLEDSFCSEIQQIIREVGERGLHNWIISLEDSNLEYVKKSERRKNIRLYPKDSGRMAGAYLIDKTAAVHLLDEISANKCHLPIDWFHNYCSRKGLIQIYWAHPTIATQGSLNGKLRSTIDEKKTGIIKTIVFSLSRMYKKLLYSLR